MDKKEWKIIDDLKGKVQQISEQQEHAEETGPRQVCCSRVCL